MSLLKRVSVFCFFTVFPFFLFSQKTFTEDFSSNSGWTQVGTNVEIRNGKLEYRNLAFDGQQRRVHKSLNDTLNSFTSFVVEFEFHPTEVGTHGNGNRYAGHTLFAITAGSSEPYNDCPDIPCTGLPTGTQDGIMVGYNARNPSTDSLFFTIRSKDDSGENRPTNRIFSNELDTTFYIKVERIACTDSTWLSVYLDSNRTLHIPGSPIRGYTPETVTNLHTVQIGNVARGDPRRGLSGFIDNLKLEWGNPDSIPSGIINRYTQVLDIKKGLCNDSIVVNNIIGLAPDDRILIIQMKGAAINTSNSNSFGDVTSYNNAGNYEFAVVSTIVANQIILDDTLSNLFDTAGKIQLIYVPKYSNTVSCGNLTAEPWDGLTGGVFAIEVEDTLELGGNIVMDGLGFRGGKYFFGAYPFSSSTCSKTDYFKPIGDANGGQKGESIVLRLANSECGRGKLATGGGGGNSHNSGGGGGGNYGKGGQGGDEWINCAQSSIGGLGGDSISYLNFANKVFLGAGGGGGEANSEKGSDGGNGGGIIFIKAGSIKGNNNTISSRGINANTATSDGAGGGGAGGSILIEVLSFIDTLRLNVDGGKGGDNNNAGSCVAPGGGGGGGLIWHSLNSLPLNVVTSTEGGKAGLFINSSQTSCFNTNYGSSPGKDGGILDSLSLSKLKTSIHDPVLLGNDTIICFGDTIIIDVKASNASFLWSDNSTDSFLVISQEGKYWVDVTLDCKIYSDTIFIQVDSSAFFDLGDDTLLCTIDSITLFGSPFNSNRSYLWNDGSTDSALTVDTTDTYWLEVTENGCKYKDSIVITFSPPVNLNLGSDTTLCNADSIKLLGSPFNSNRSYLWSDGSTDSILIARSSNTYWLEATEGSCSSRDSISIAFNSLNLNFGPDTSICIDDTLVLDATNASANYLWQDGVNSPTYNVTDSGLYYVTVNNFCGTIEDSIQINLEECVCDFVIPNIFSPNFDGINDVFMPKSNCEFIKYSLVIYNRWGNKVFESLNLNQGWDGRTKGRKASQGIYFYSLFYQLSGGVTREFNGTITLAR